MNSPSSDDAGRTRDVAVVGGGPAGLACAIRAARYGLDIAVSMEPAGLWSYWSGKVHTHFGFPEGISGRALLERARAQAEGLGVEIIHSSAVGAAVLEGAGFELRLQVGPESDPPLAITSQFLVLADALADVPERIAIALARANIPPSAAFAADETELIGKRVVVFADGASGLRTVLELTSFAEAVTAVVPPGIVGEVMRERLDAAGAAVTEQEIDAFEGNGEGLRQVLFRGGERLECDAGFVAVEPTAVLALAEALDLERADGRIQSDKRCRTSLSGCYAVGTGSHWRALTEAEAEGARAALDMWMRTRRSRLGA